MSELTEMIADGRQAGHRPWPRAAVDVEAWTFACRQLAGGHWTLSALWGEPACVHMALLDVAGGAFGIMSLETESRRYPSVGTHHAPALRLERTIRDLYGLVAEGSPDPRPWLDHGRWGVHAPLGDAREAGAVEPYRFLPVEGHGVHQIPVGPIHAGIIEPGHFRFSASGETVVRLEERLGYVHKGIEALLVGAPLDRAAKLAGRASGDTTVAYASAFSQAIEAAWDVRVPPRAAYIRAIMLELERIANHLGDIGAICNDAAFSLMLTHCAVLRERVLRAAEKTFGHRLMMDCVIPGGVIRDLDRARVKCLRRLLADIRRRFPALIRLYDETTSLQDRTVGTGVLSSALAHKFGAGGYVGRASGRAFDVRKAFPQAPYDLLGVEPQTRERGDVDSRVWVRIREVEGSLALITRMLDTLPEGSIRMPLRLCAGEGSAMVEGFRGDIFVWVRLNGDGTIARAHLRDPSCFQWPLLEAAIEGNIVADFPLCNKSFNCSYAGHDL
jgi:Ni,Fe-hydrogenase III large subunit